eukprot:COSAG05_NODE_7355_length_823_cov_1.581492_1_plen_50_part_01
MHLRRSVGFLARSDAPEPHSAADRHRCKNAGTWDKPAASAASAEALAVVA